MAEGFFVIYTKAIIKQAAVVPPTQKRLSIVLKYLPQEEKGRYRGSADTGLSNRAAALLT